MKMSREIFTSFVVCVPLVSKNICSEIHAKESSILRISWHLVYGNLLVRVCTAKYDVEYIRCSVAIIQQNGGMETLKFVAETLHCGHNV